MRYWIITFVLLFGGIVGCKPPVEPASITDSVSDLQESATESPADEPPESATEAAQETGGDSRLELELVTLEVPTGWTRNPAGSSFLLAEFSLPGDEGDAGVGRLTVSVAGGSVDANIDRWRGQFAGELTAEAKSNFEVNGLPVTMVDFAGDFNDRQGLRPNYRMLAAIVSVDGQSHFFKATGPQPTMAHQLKAFEAFIKSIKRR